MDAEVKPELRGRARLVALDPGGLGAGSSVGNGLEFKDIPRWIEFLDRVVVGGKTAFRMTASKPSSNSWPRACRSK